MKKFTVLTAIIFFACNKQDVRPSIAKDSSFAELIKTVEPVLAKVAMDRNYRPDANWPVLTEEEMSKFRKAVAKQFMRKVA